MLMRSPPDRRPRSTGALISAFLFAAIVGPEATARGETVRFAVIGDYGDSGDGTRAVAEMVDRWAPDFVLTTGDNSYTSNIDANVGQYYHQFISPYQGVHGNGCNINRFIPSLGNHDWDSVLDCNASRCNGSYLDYFTLPGNERYYSSRWGPVEVFVLDSDNREPDGTTSNSVQAAWLRSELGRSGALWKLICFHEPPFASGFGSSAAMRWPFQEWGASAVLSGHVHVYECLVKNGFPYFINGLGGRSRHPLGSPQDPDSRARYNGGFGAMLVEADSESIVFRFYSVAGGGMLIDTYAIDSRARGTTTWGSIKTRFR